jgi:hypothetical protein
MARRPDMRETEMLSEENLKELRHNLAHLSLPAVREFYEVAHRDCRLVYNHLPSPRRYRLWCRCGSNYRNGAEPICHNLFKRCVGDKGCRGVNRSSRNTSTASPAERGPEPTIQHCSHSACPHHSPASERATPRAVASPLGPESLLGQGRVRCCRDDQREIGISHQQARVSRCAEVSPVPHPC